MILSWKHWFVLGLIGLAGLRAPAQVAPQPLWSHTSTQEVALKPLLQKDSSSDTASNTSWLLYGSSSKDSLPAPIYSVPPGVVPVTRSMPASSSIVFPDFSYDDDSGQQAVAGANTQGTPGPRESGTRIRWNAANGEALMATGIDHIFNLWTEAGTRDALYGPWAQQWLQSVSELRGWSDSDRFMAPYVGYHSGLYLWLHPATE